MQIAGCTIAHWCRQQDKIALSSAEAELKSSCKGVAEALGIREIIVFLFQREIGQGDCILEHCTDASAAVGIMRRKGSGKLKHLSVRQLWVQEVFAQGFAMTNKIPREENAADLLCSLPTAASLANHLPRLGLHAPTPPRGESARRTGSDDVVAEMPAGRLADAWTMILELLRVPDESF